MANIKKSASELVGHTPLMEVTHYEEKNGIGCNDSRETGVF